MAGKGKTAPQKATVKKKRATSKSKGPELVVGRFYKVDRASKTRGFAPLVGELVKGSKLRLWVDGKPADRALYSISDTSGAVTEISQAMCADLSQSHLTETLHKA